MPFGENNVPVVAAIEGFHCIIFMQVNGMLVSMLLDRLEVVFDFCHHGLISRFLTMKTALF